MNVEKELAALEQMTVGQLREKYAEAFGEPSHSRHKQYLAKRIIWRMQANAEGGLSERALARARELANEADLRVVAPKQKVATPTIVKIPVESRADRRLPPAGTVITREYKGRDLRVKVLTDGFEHQGEQFKTLSAVAKAITGQHCNGYLFFRLNGKGGRS